MARATRLKIQNLFNHPATEIEPSTINLFVGDEGDGKTAILNALDLAATGRCRLDRVDGEKLTNDELWDAIAYDKREASEQPRVTVELTGVEGKKATIQRGRRTWSMKLEDGTQITTREGLAAFLGVRTMDAVEVAFRSHRFLGMKSEEKVRLLFTALASPLTAEDLEAQGVTDKEVQSRVLTRGVKSGCSLATDKRVLAMRQAESLEGAPPAEKQVETLKGLMWVKDIDRAKVAGNLAALEEKRKEVQKNLGAAEAKRTLSSEVRLLAEATEDSEKAEKAAAKVKAALVALLESEEATKIDGLRKQKSQLLKDYEAIRAAIMELKARETMLAEAVVAAEEKVAVVQKLEGQEVVCPFCAGVCDRSLCLARLDVAVGAAKTKLEECRTSIATEEATLGQVKQEGTFLTKQIAEFDARVTAAKTADREARGVAQVAKTHAANMQAEVEKAKAAAAANDPGESENALIQKDAELTVRIERARTILAAVDNRAAMLKEYEEAKEKAKTLREAEKKYAAMEMALSEAGFVAQMVAKPLSLLREKVAEITAGTEQLRVDLAIEIRDDLTVYSRGRPVESSSRGQQWIVGAVLAAAMVSLTKIGILVLDDMNMIGPAARNKMLSTLRKMAQAAEIEQVFVACVRGDSGWCDACGSLSVGDAKGCILSREGKRCGARVGPSRPRGAMAHILKTYEVIDGTVTEVTPLGAASVQA